MNDSPNRPETTAAIVRELRERVVGHPRLMTAAADEIERLERERDEMSALALRDGREVERLHIELRAAQDALAHILQDPRNRIVMDPHHG